MALSGGAARAIAHIAVLEVLEQEGVPIHFIAGTSAGSIIGALYAAGIPLSGIRRIVLKTNWKNVIQYTLPRKGFLSSEGIFRYMERVLPVRDFSSLVFPFAAVATDLRTGRKVTFRTGSIAKAVQASCSIPVIFTPTEINDEILVDGGFTSMIPVQTAREELGAQIVISVNVNYQALAEDKLDSLVSIATHLSALWASRNSREEEKLADVAIQVNTKGIALYDLSKSDELLKRGREAAEKKVPSIKALIGS